MSGFVVRDKNGILKLFRYIPIRVPNNFWLSDEETPMILPTEFFPDITWESEPTRVTISLKKD